MDASHERQPNRLPTLTPLDLFSRTVKGRTVHHEVSAADRRALWAADALHRANNLAQLSSSLGSSGLRHLHGVHANDRSAQARALSRAYAELGAAEMSKRAVPCAPLLGTIAMRLVALFGGERAIRLHVATDHVVLPPEQRRALVLIASELVINALKYAFADDAFGVITITLSQWGEKIEMSVADNGRGIASDGASNGTGLDLIQRLAALLNAELHQFSSEGGLRVVVSLSVIGT